VVEDQFFCSAGSGLLFVVSMESAEAAVLDGVIVILIFLLLLNLLKLPFA